MEPKTEFCFGSEMEPTTEFRFGSEMEAKKALEILFVGHLEHMSGCDSVD